MNKSIDCRKREHRNGLKCELKGIHNKLCKNRSSEFGNATKTILSLTSPKIAATIAIADISKATYKELFCEREN